MAVFQKPDSGVGRIPRHCGVRSARRPLGIRKACARPFSPTVKKSRHRCETANRFMAFPEYAT